MNDKNYNSSFTSFDLIHWVKCIRPLTGSSLTFKLPSAMTVHRAKQYVEEQLPGWVLHLFSYSEDDMP